MTNKNATVSRLFNNRPTAILISLCFRAAQQMRLPGDDQSSIRRGRAVNCSRENIVKLNQPAGGRHAR